MNSGIIVEQTSVKKKKKPVF